MSSVIYATLQVKLYSHSHIATQWFIFIMFYLMIVTKWLQCNQAVKEVQWIEWSAKSSAGLSWLIARSAEYLGYNKRGGI